MPRVLHITYYYNINYSFLFKGERKKYLKDLTYFSSHFEQRTFFSIIKFVFRGQREFYLFYYNPWLQPYFKRLRII